MTRLQGVKQLKRAYYNEALTLEKPHYTWADDHAGDDSPMAAAARITQIWGRSWLRLKHKESCKRHKSKKSKRNIIIIIIIISIIIISIIIIIIIDSIIIIIIINIITIIFFLLSHS